MEGTFSTVGDSLITVGIHSVLWRLFSTVQDKITTVGDSFSIVEGIQYIGGITSVQWGYLQYCGDNISTVEVAQCSGDKT